MKVFFSILFWLKLVRTFDKKRHFGNLNLYFKQLSGTTTWSDLCLLSLDNKLPK